MIFCVLICFNLKEIKTLMEVDNQQEKENKGTVNTKLLLNKHLLSKEPTAINNEVKNDNIEETAIPRKTITLDKRVGTYYMGQEA